MPEAPTGSILAHWDGYQLTMRCLVCSWVSTRPAAELIACFGGDLPVTQAPALQAKREGCRKEDCAVGFDGAAEMAAEKPKPSVSDTIDKSKILIVNDLREWHVVLAICPCGHRSPVDIKAVAHRMRGGKMLKASQFRCTRCGNREGNRFSVRMMAR